jgi:hypothetical protein
MSSLDKLKGAVLAAAIGVIGAAWLFTWWSS